MRIDLKEIPDAGQDFHLRIDRDAWRPAEDEDGILGLNEPLRVDMEVLRAGDTFSASGRIRGSVLLRCDRCLGTFVRKVDSGFQALFVQPEEGNEDEERELDDADLGIEIPEDGEVDILDLIREQILLDQPMKRICGEDCKGMCARCGKNLNEGPCACTAEQGHPAFQQLSALKEKGKEE